MTSEREMLSPVLTPYGNNLFLLKSHKSNFYEIQKIFKRIKMKFLCGSSASCSVFVREVFVYSICNSSKARNVAKLNFGDPQSD